MNNYRKPSIKHPSGLFILNTFKQGVGGGDIWEGAYLIYNDDGISSP